MHISQYFLRGDVRGAIAHMRAHEEFRDVLPAYLAIFENCEYRTYGIPAPLNDILRLYQIYFRDTFYCGLPEAEAADKLLARLKKRLDLPDADEARLTERLQAAFEAEGYHALFGKTASSTASAAGNSSRTAMSRANRSPRSCIAMQACAAFRPAGARTSAASRTAEPSAAGPMTPCRGPTRRD